MNDENRIDPEQASIELDEILLDVLAVFVVSAALLCACLLIAASS